MSQKVSIESIKFEKTLYPRIEADNATVNQYRQSIDKLPPILVTKDLILVDGYHRLLAHKLEGRTEILVEFFESNEPGEILLEAIKRNSAFGKQLSTKEKRQLAPRLWEAGFNDVEKIASILSVDVRSARDYTEKLREEEQEKRDTEILDLYLQCYSYREIEQKLDLGHGTASNILEKSGKLSEILQPDDLEFYNVWSVGILDKDQLKYPGQTPRDLIENIVYYYSEPPQREPFKISKVVDPMAGSGIVRDICLKLVRRYALFDILPLREDIPIIQNDILKGFPDKAKNADLVYFDPPYFSLMEEYPKTDFNKDYPSFLSAMETSFKNIKTILSKHGKLAVILKPMNVKMLEGEWLDLTFDSISLAKKQGYKILKRISAPLSTQQFSPSDVTRAKEQKVMLNTLRDIVILAAD